jgi:hypothetical protein
VALPEQGTGYRLHLNIDTDLKESQWIGVPGIAIPVNRKQQFECPDEHVANLAQNLPNVRKILVVGWQGKEQRFLELLKQTLTNKLQRLLVVSAQEDASAVLENLKLELQLNRADCQAFGQGFSKFIYGHQGKSFFSD